MKNFMNYSLPEIIIKNGKEKIFDPIRKKFFNVKPEEIVRQHLISFLIDELKVPKNLIRVEEILKHYGIKTKERADIIVDFEIKNLRFPLLVIECKAPEIFLDDKAREQMFGYSEKLKNKYCWLTNGEENYFYYLGEKIDEIPNYSEMLGGKYNPAPVEEFESRAELEDLKEKYLDYVDKNIFDETPENLAIPITNFFECLLDVDHKFPAKKYKIFSVVKDYGVRNLTVGNNSGYKWEGAYRSFLIKYNNFENFVSISTSYIDSPIYICVAVERDNNTVHHSLQLNIETNFVTYDKKIRFLHDGRMAVGNKGSAPVDGLRKLVSEKYPEIIRGKKFYLGTLTQNRLFYLDDEEVMQVIENLISYALIRDDYRAMF